MSQSRGTRKPKITSAFPMEEFIPKKAVVKVLPKPSRNEDPENANVLRNITQIHNNYRIADNEKDAYQEKTAEKKNYEEKTVEKKIEVFAAGVGDSPKKLLKSVDKQTVLKEIKSAVANQKNSKTLHKESDTIVVNNKGELQLNQNFHEKQAEIEDLSKKLNEILTGIMKRFQELKTIVSE